MAEALGVAGSIVSFVGLAGQIAQGINYLYNFFHSIHDAPGDIRSLTEELRVLGLVLNEVEADGTDTYPLRAALAQCKHVIGDLESLVQRAGLGSEHSRVRKLWSQMGVAFRKEKFRQYTERLERLKSTLLNARITVHGSMHQQQLSGIKDVQARLTKISVENSEATTTNSETASWTRNELQTLPSRISELVVEEVSTTMAKKHATCTTILTEIRENGMRADQSNEDIRLALQSLLSSENTGKIAALLLPALEKAVSDRIAASLEGLTAHSVTAQPESIRQVTNAGSSLNNIPQEQELQSSVMSLNSLSSTTTCISWAGDSRVFGFWFGKLLVTNSTMITWQGCGDDVNIRKTEFLETKATLIPSRWLLRKGVILTIRRLVSAIVAPVVHFSLTPIMVISGDHEIVDAMCWGNIARVKSLVLNGSVHPSSIFPDGSNIVHKCLQMTHSVSLIPLEYSDSDKKKFIEFWGDPGLDGVRSNLGTFNSWNNNILRIASWLVDQGPDLDQINSDGECCFSSLVNLLDHSHLMQNTSEEAIRQLAISLLRASKSSPLIIRHEESMQVLPTETFRTADKHMWNFAGVIAEASQSDNCTLTCLVALQALCSLPPYQQDNELWMLASVFEIPETGLRLIQKAIAGKMWLAGDSQDSARCSYLLYRSILGVLVFASPYKAHEHRAYVWWLIRLSQQQDIHRTKLINLIAGMLQFDTNIVNYSGGDGSLTDCAIRWRSLDIWKFALAKAGLQPHSVIDQDLWNSNAHLYDPLGFASLEPGTSICATADLNSGKILLVVDERLYVPEELNYLEDKFLGSEYDCEWPRRPEMEELTRNWPYLFNLPRVHCEVYPSRTTSFECESFSAEHPRAYPSTEEASATDQPPSTQYTLHPTEDGGIELFIDICECGEPYHRICAEVKREREQREGRNSHEVSVNQETTENSKRVFSKIVGAGVDILSAFV